jgi:hypothetical protein
VFEKRRVAQPWLCRKESRSGGKKLLRGYEMVLKERVHALADGARARKGSDERPEQSEDDAAKRAVIHELENWAALHSEDLNSPSAVIFFFTHLQEKKPELLNFDCADKCETIHGWLLQEGRIQD